MTAVFKAIYHVCRNGRVLSTHKFSARKSTCRFCWWNEISVWSISAVKDLKLAIRGSSIRKIHDLFSSPH